MSASSWIFHNRFSDSKLVARFYIFLCAAKAYLFCSVAVVSHSAEKELILQIGVKNSYVNVHQTNLTHAWSMSLYSGHPCSCECVKHSISINVCCVVNAEMSTNHLASIMHYIEEVTSSTSWAANHRKQNATLHYLIGIVWYRQDWLQVLLYN